MLKASNIIPEKRFVIFRGVILALMLSLGLRFFYLQVYKHEIYKNQAEVNRTRAIPLYAPRGMILDRNNKIIVDNYPTYLLTATPGEMIDQKNNFAIMSQCTGIDSVQLMANFKKYYRGKFLSSRIAKDLTFEQLSKIEEHKHELTGVNYTQFHERSFPSSIHASHLLGYVIEVDKNILNSLQVKSDYFNGELIGWKGLEKVYEKSLKGEKGVRFVQVDAMGREMGVPTDYQPKIPIPGKDLKTTIDISLQEMMENELEGKKAVGLVSNPKTGEILAMVSKPDYSPYLFTGFTTDKTWEEIISDPDKPLLNRITDGLYPPGSTLKMITAMTLLEKGKVNLSETIYCRGVYRLGNRQFHCWNEKGHGYVNLEKAIAQSCNVYFYNFVQRLTLDEWSDACQSFGFGSRTNIDMDSESKGILPNSNYMNNVYGIRGWSKGNLLNLALGQGELSVTPIQMLQYINLLATHGQTYELHLASDQDFGKKINDQFSNQTWDQIATYMHNVVNAPSGTGKRANPQISGLQVYGKTGTAQNPHGKDHAWFVGYGKLDDQMISVVILVENGGKGSESAAPVAAKVFKFIFDSEQSRQLVFAS